MEPYQCRAHQELVERTKKMADLFADRGSTHHFSVRVSLFLMLMLTLRKNDGRPVVRFQLIPTII